MRKGILIPLLVIAASAEAQVSLKQFEFVNFSQVNVTDR
jgi:hypothetical protein